MATPKLEIGEVRRRIVQLVTHGDDAGGGCTLSKLPAAWNKAYGSKFDVAEYGFAKLGALLRSMADIVELDQCGPGTRSVVRLAGVTPRQLREPQPQHSGGGGGGTVVSPRTASKSRRKRGTPAPGAAAGGSQSPQKSAELANGAPAMSGGIAVDFTATTHMGWADEMEASEDWADTAEPAPDWGDAAEPALDWGSADNASVADERPPVPPQQQQRQRRRRRQQQQQQQQQQQHLQALPPPSAQPRRRPTAQPIVPQNSHHPHPQDMAASVQSFFQQFGNDGDGGQGAYQQMKSHANGGPGTGTTHSNQREPGGQPAQQSSKQKQRREQAELRKRQEKVARKSRGMRTKLSKMLESGDPAGLLQAIDESAAFEDDDVRSARTAAQDKYDSLVASTLEELAPIVAEGNLTAAQAAIYKYSHFPGEVAGVCQQLRDKLNRAKCDLREAVKAANLSVLNASIEQYSDEGRAVSKELKEAKVKRSELMSKCARELAVLVHEDQRRPSTAKQIAHKLAKYKGYPAEGSIGESMASLQKSLVTRQAEEAEKQRLVDQKRKKEEAVRAKQQAKLQQEEEEAAFWSKLEDEEKEAEADQARLWEEARLRSEAQAAALEIEERERAEVAAALAAASVASLTPEEIEQEQARKRERKLAKKRRQQEARALSLAEAQADEALRAERKLRDAADSPLRSVLRTSPHFSPESNKPGRSVKWLDLNESMEAEKQAAEEAAQQELEARRREAKTLANRKKKEKKKKKAMERQKNAECEELREGYELLEELD